MRFTISAILLLFAAACSATPPDDRVIEDAEDTTAQALPGPSEQGGTGELAAEEQCDAAEYRPLVGSNVDETVFQTGPNLRVFGVNDIVTQDYLPQRTNVVHDNARTIMRIYCG